jgi:hypothetical protein
MVEIAAVLRMSARLIAKIMPARDQPRVKLIGLSKRDQWELDELRRRRELEQQRIRAETKP